MKILVIGANGQLGWELCSRGRDKGFDILALDCSLIETRFGISPRPWQEALREMMPRLVSDGL